MTAQVRDVEHEEQPLNTFDLMTDPVKPYTSFWPVFIVFFFFTVTAILQLIANIQTKSHLVVAVNQLAQRAQQSQVKEAALSGLAHDVLALAPTSAVAQQIVTDFQIQVRNQAPRQGVAAGSPATPAPAASPNTAPNQ